MKNIVINKKVRHDYFIEETYEAGLILKGSEIKSIREKKVNIEGAYVLVKNNEAFLINMHIAKYKFSSVDFDENRTRKLLLNKNQILKLKEKKKKFNFTIVPLRLYIKDSLAKIEIALAKGKKLYDKRKSIAEKDIKRKIEKRHKIRVWKFNKFL